MTTHAAIRTMGHLALHYGPAADAEAAASLMRALGFIETQMLPLPGGNFYRFVVDERHAARGDGIIYLSAVPDAQRALTQSIHDALKLGRADEHEAVRDMRAMLAEDPEASFHVGFLIDSFDALEAMVLDMQHRAAHDPLLKGRVSVRINRPRPGDTAIDAQLDASPAFAGVTRHAYGRAGIQLFIETDLLKAGLLGDAMVLEFDYVFPGHDSHILSVVEL
jgi:hypothetical protein